MSGIMARIGISAIFFAIVLAQSVGLERVTALLDPIGEIVGHDGEQLRLQFGGGGAQRGNGFAERGMALAVLDEMACRLAQRVADIVVDIELARARDLVVERVDGGIKLLEAEAVTHTRHGRARCRWAACRSHPRNG